MRLLGGLGLVAPVGLAILLFADPNVLFSWVDDGARSILAAMTAAMVGVSLSSLLIFAYVRYRFGRLIQAAERMASGDLAVAVEVPPGGLESRLATAINALSVTIATTQEAASIDKLTGVANRQSLLGALFTEVERATRYSRPFSVAFVDIDHFKAVNDSYGHAVGDVVLRGVAQAIKTHLRNTDTLGRYGGEEFMLLLSETDVDEAALLAEKLRQLVQRLRFSVDGNPNLTVTVSIGIAGGIGQLLRVDALVRDADAAMYSAKSLGRNQTYIFAEPDDDARVPRAPISPLGRARAMEVGRAAREAATAALTAIVAPLPHYSGQPSALIASIVVTMGRQLDLPEPEIDRLKVAALLHDLGKVAVPAEILEKPTSLSSAEWRSVVQHPRIGQVILEQATTLRDAVPIILHHHERYSGHGYPYGLRGNDIPLGARIVAIADAYDAMTHDRPYKPAMTHEQAIAELRRHSGTQFDPELIAVFCDLYARRAPQPDARVVAMIAASAAHHGSPAAPGVPRPTAVPAEAPGASEPEPERGRKRPRQKPSGELATG
ncbi:MAG TPA: diguanylate cyclase [Candidatus Limnocylindrales bacterium]